MDDIDLNNYKNGDLETVFDVDISSGGATGLQQVLHDETLIGDGTAANPLGVDTTKFITQAELDTEIQDRTDADNVLLDQINANTAMIIDKQDKINDLATIRSGANKGATAVQPGELATVARTGSYADLINKPVIPTVNNSTITIKQGGNVKGTFTLNQATGKTIELDAGGGAGEMPKPTRDYSMGSASGNWVEMTTAQKNALNSGATAEKINEIDTNKTTMDNHIANKNNPHDVTKAQVGLGNVDNTSDANKPISTATQTALDGKQPKSTSNFSLGNATGTWTALTTAQQNSINSGVTSAKITSYDTHLTNKTNPHEVTKAQVGLGNVDNTSDANKPISTATQTALDGKQPKSTSAFSLGNASGTWTALTTAQQDAINSGATSTNIAQITTNQTAIANEKTARENADEDLQDQIDALVSKSDVVDVVGTYADLQAYPTTTLHNNDVVKVISDSTHSGAPSYYRWVITGTTGAWTYIGSLADSYTKAETNALLNAKQDNLTTAQLSAVNSGVTASTVAQVATNTTAIAGKQNTLTAGSNITITGATISATDTTYTGSDGITLTGTNFTNSGVRSIAQGATNGTISVNTNGTSAEVAVKGLGTAAYTASTAYATSAQGAKADTAVQPADLATVATSGDYDDLSNKPTINNSTITITQNGATKGTFTLNQATAGTVELDSIDELTITKNSSSKMQAVATVNQNTATGATSRIYDWVGTLAQYTAQDIENQHPDWICFITDDESGYTSLLDVIYPVGSIYIGTQSSCPLASLISDSVWELVSAGRALWGGNGSNANTTIEAGLPNITAGWTAFMNNATGAVQGDDTGGGADTGKFTKLSSFTFNASRSSSIYGKSSTVQPPAYIVNVWRRTA